MFYRSVINFVLNTLFFGSFFMGMASFSKWLYSVDVWLCASWLSFVVFLMTGSIAAIRSRLEIQGGDKFVQDDFSKFIDDLLESKVGKG